MLKLLCIALVLGWGGNASADPRATELLNRGYAFYEQGDYAAAIIVFQQAHALAPEPRLLLNIALSQEKLPGQCGATLATFERFFEACRTCALAGAARADAQRIRARCLARVQIETEPRDALLRVGDRPAISTPIAVDLPAGEHRLRLRRAGFEPLDRTVRVDWTERARLILTLRPAADRSGQIVARNLPPDVVVTLGEARLTDTPLVVPPGPQTLRVQTADGDRPLPVLVRPGGVTEIDLGAALIAPPVDYRAEAGWSAIAGGVGLVTGAVFSVFLAQDLQTERDARTRSVGESAKDDAVRNALIAQTGYGLAVAGLGTALTLWLLSDPAE